MINFLKTFILLILIFNFGVQAQQSYSYLDPNLPPVTRAKLLLKEMTLEEKIGQLNLDFNCPPSDLSKAITSDKVGDLVINDNDKDYLNKKWEEDILAGRIGVTRNIQSREHANRLQKLAEQSRLKIPLFIVHNHVWGVGKDGYTQFPSYISMASSFNPDLVEKAAAVIARESRTTGINWTFAPTVDISRDARWGRTGETWGEDPLLAGEMGVAVVRGFQFDNPREHRVIACLKHYIAGGQAQNALNVAPVDISERTLRTFYIPPFKKTIQAGAKSVMAGHNDFQGIPCHANKYLLTDILKKELGFKGFVISDWLDIERLVTLHHVAKDFKEACYLSFSSGVDVHNHGKGYIEALSQLVTEGRIKETAIDSACFKLLVAKFELGLFENRYTPDPEAGNLIKSEEALNLSLELARQSLVLLKNEKNLLPLNGKKPNIFITGQNANNNSILGDWTYDKHISGTITIKDGLLSEAPENFNINWYDCGDSVNIQPEHIEKSYEQARKADVIILALGGNHFRPLKKWEKTGGENRDVQDLELFGNQTELLKKMKKTGKPIIIILTGGRPLAMEKLAPCANVILQAWEPGMFAGKAIAEVIFGKYNPSGKLPISLPRTTGQVNVWYNHNPSAYFRNFVYGGMGAYYEFGYGLSYTNYSYSNLEFRKQINATTNLKVSVTVKNDGDVDGEEIVLCYINDVVSSVVTPVKKLVAFKRVSLKAKEKKIVELVITPDNLSLWNVNMENVVEKGTFELIVGPLKSEFEVI